MFKVRWVVKIGIASLLLISMCVFANIRNKTRLLEIEKIHIEDATNIRFVTDSMVQILLNQGNAPYLETTFSEAEIRQREKLLLKNPFIDKANVFIAPNGKTQITLSQESPIVRINNGLEEFYLSTEAEKIPLSSRFSAQVLLATGNIQTEDFRNVIDFCQLQIADNLLTKHINGIHKASQKSFILTVNLGSYIILLGELTNMDSKMENLKVFFASSYYEKNRNKITKIDLRFLNQVVITKKTSHE